MWEGWGDENGIDHGVVAKSSSNANDSSFESFQSLKKEPQSAFIDRRPMERQLETYISIAEYMQGGHKIDELSSKDRERIISGELKEEIALQAHLALRLYPELKPGSHAFSAAEATVRLEYSYLDGVRYWWTIGESLLRTLVYRFENGEWQIMCMRRVGTL